MQLTCIMKVLCRGLLLAAAAVAQTPRGEIAGRVADPSGAVIPDALVRLEYRATGLENRARTAGDGSFRFAEPPAGDYTLEVTQSGFAPGRRSFRLRSGETVTFDIELQPATIAEEVRVSAGQIAGTPEHLERLPGSITVLSSAALTEARVFTTEEALRKVPGVHARAEEGFGLRPNIGIRGLNPTRSTRVLLLEDGLPLSYAPYGDNASYYHPPVDRFDSVEVVKGGGQILYGPMTVGGVINYVTDPPPASQTGFVSLMGGNRDYLNAHARYGNAIGRTGFVLDALRKQGEGARENLRHGVSDFNAKTLTPLGGNQTLGFRFNYYNEDSNVTYSGLREAEWLVNPRGNPFRNDFFHVDRYGASALHTWAPAPDVVVSTSVYGSTFFRDWWRQSSNSSQRPNDAACGGMANLLTTCGNEGRLRKYYTWGLDPKVRAAHRWFGIRSESDFGIRYHSELQERIQQNGAFPTARSGRVVEDNQRRARAWSGFFQNRFTWNRLSITPGVRLEHVDYDRTNRLGNQGQGVFGATSLTKAIPGLGLAYQVTPGITLFTGLHRGFAPPRVEDIINNNTGASMELDPELSWNYEAGVRASVTRDLRLEATFFRMNFQNQIVPASVAGGLGAVLTNAGETLHQGGEFSWRWDVRNVASSRHNLSLRGAYTWLPSSRYTGTRFSSVPGFTAVSITGNRLPYSPENLFTGSVLYSHARGFNGLLEAVYTGSQFGDDLNTRGGTPDGQRGLLPGNAIWNATFNYPIEAWRTTAFVTCKNLFDRLAIADRTRGLLPTGPRLVQAGFRFTF